LVSYNQSHLPKPALCSGVLPLDAICTRAEIDMRSIVREQPDLAAYVSVSTVTTIELVLRCTDTMRSAEKSVRHVWWLRFVLATFLMATGRWPCLLSTNPLPACLYIAQDLKQGSKVVARAKSGVPVEAR